MTESLTILKPTVIVTTALGILEREISIPTLVWRDPVGDFAGAKDDTISIRLPAYATARTRVLRSGTTRTRDDLAERKVDVSLTTGVYKDIIISDEQLSLDIVDFGNQVLNPAMSGVARKLEDILVATIEGADYEVELDLDVDQPYKTAVLARKALNDARVPFNGRAMVVGSSVEAKFLNSDQFVRASWAGNTDAFREANIGRVAGFDVYTSPALEPDEAYAFHKTAFVMSSRAPLVPRGFTFGASMSDNGFAIRVVELADSTEVQDVLALDSWVGTSVVTDSGTFDGYGRFIPSETEEDIADSDNDLFVRAVKINGGASS